MESEEFALALAAALGEEFSVTVCGVAQIGTHLAEADGLVLELELTGPEFAEENRHRLPAAVLELTPVVTKAIGEDAAALGLCLVRIPCTPSHAAARLRSLLAQTAQKNTPPFGGAMDCPDSL